MEQFNLDAWLNDKSRKVVVETGNDVKIISTEAPDDCPIVGYIYNEGIWLGPFCWNKKGISPTTHTINQKKIDLFFADEKEIKLPLTKQLEEYFKKTPKEQIEKDWQEIKDWYNQYYTDESNEEEELTEFEQELRYWIEQSLCNYETNGCVLDNMSDSANIYLKAASKKLLNLARKEIKKDIEHSAVEFAKSYMEDVNPSFEKVKESEELWKWKMSCLSGVNKAYKQGKQDALKSLPK